MLGNGFFNDALDFMVKIHESATTECLCNDGGWDNDEYTLSAETEAFER